MDCTLWLKKQKGKTKMDVQIRNAICDLLDVRNILPKEYLESPKDNDGTIFTIDDCLENAINILEELERKK